MIGKKIYYDKATGNIIQVTAEVSFGGRATSVEEDFESHTSLKERVPETVGMIQLEFSQYAQDFSECNGYTVDVVTNTLKFSYPDPATPQAPPVFQKPLSEEIEILKQRDTQLSDDNSLMLEALITAGLIS